MTVTCYLCVGQPGPAGCRRCGGTGIDSGFTGAGSGRVSRVWAASPLLGLPGGMSTAALVSGAVIALLFLPRRRLKLAATVALLLAAVAAGLLPGTGGGAVGGPLAAGAPVPGVYRPWLAKAGSLCPQVSAALLAAQLRQESGFNPNARSSVGAMGIAQFMPGTWSSWAVDADGDGIASPWEPADAIVAQGRFMCALAGRYGGRTDLMLAAYNAGPGAVDAAGGVPAISETRNYVRTITAATAAFTTP